MNTDSDALTLPGDPEPLYYSPPACLHLRRVDPRPPRDQGGDYDGYDLPLGWVCDDEEDDD